MSRVPHPEIWLGLRLLRPKASLRPEFGILQNMYSGFQLFTLDLSWDPTIPTSCLRSLEPSQPWPEARDPRPFAGLLSRDECPLLCLVEALATWGRFPNSSPF